MAIKFTALPAANALDGTEILAVVQDGDSKRTTADLLVAPALDRANHTGSQTAATISDFVDEVIAAAPVTSVNGQSGPVELFGNDISEPVIGLTSTAGVVNIDCAAGDYFTLGLTENVTSITFSNLPASGLAQTIMVRILQHASAAKTVAFPASFKWAGGTVGVVSTALSAYDLLAITTFDQGTRWETTLAKAFA